MSEQRRVASLELLPDESLLCMWRGHQWSDPPVIDAPGWGGLASQIDLQCPCGRWRKDVIEDASDELKARDYGGGVLLLAGAEVRRWEARAEWMRRTRARQTGVTTVAEKRRRAAARQEGAPVAKFSG